MVKINCYKKSTDITMHKVIDRNTQRSTHIVFRTDSDEGSLYKRSPYFVGTKLQGALTIDTIELPDINTFKASIKHLNRAYIDLFYL